MRPYNENRLHQADNISNTDTEVDTSDTTSTNISTWILICIILGLVNVILGLL